MIKKIVIVGSVNNDLVITSPEMPQMGKTIMGEGFFTAPGGKGANQAVAAARLGGIVYFIGAVGDDSFGKELKNNLILNDINTDYVQTIKSVPTGTAVIVVNQGDNFIVLDSGANNFVTTESVENAKSFIKCADIVMLQLEIPYETVIHTIRMCSENNVKVLLNPAPAREIDLDTLSRVDIITPNKDECESLTGIKIENIQDAEAAVKKLLAKGVKQVFLTLGEKGVVYNNGEIIKHEPAHNVSVVDTTAAGDTFSGAIAVALTEGMLLEDAVKFANKAASLTVQKKGAQPSIPRREQI